MSRAAKSLFAFGIYVIGAGVSFLAAPSMAVSLLRLPPATDGWVRVVGLLALVIGTYDLIGSRAESIPYIKGSVWTRFSSTVMRISSLLPLISGTYIAPPISGSAWNVPGTSARNV